MVQEAVASSLIPATFEQLFLLIGGGANGKSTILHLLGHLHAGSSQASDMSTLMGRWWGETLLGKTLLTVSEMPDYVDKEGCQRLKQLASRDVIFADRKNRTGFTFRPRATLFLASNHPVRFQDTSAGMMRKVTTLAFTQRIPEAEMIRDYNTLITGNPDELAIVVDWALAGVQRLIRNGKQFSAPSKASVAIRDENALASSAVLAWIHDCDVSRDDHTWTDKTKIFRHFNHWCLRNNRKGQVDATFWREIRTRLFDGAPLAELRQRTREGRVRCVNLRIDAPDAFESIDTIDNEILF
jgi:phage/plasmid-associated DNA primase